VVQKARCRRFENTPSYVQKTPRRVGLEVIDISGRGGRLFRLRNTCDS
jgi:hypothetical protein